MTKHLKPLFDSLQKRYRPEDVAEMVLSTLKDQLTPMQSKLLNTVAANSLRRHYDRWTSMAQDFHRPVVPFKQTSKAAELFKVPALSAEEATDPDRITKVMRKASASIKKTVGENDWKAHRLSDEGRERAGLDISRRRYNKLFRFLVRFEKKIGTYRLEMRKYKASRIAKSSLATHIPWNDFKQSDDAACFIAYFSARANRRSVFTNQSQDRPFDLVAKMLLNRVKKNAPQGAWRAIARVMPDVEVVRAMDDAGKQILFKEWTDVLVDIADLLKTTWEKSGFNRSTMIVKRGDDSSSWNALAGAWNMARQGWISFVMALGLDELLDMVCFGKAMRLMAADVAYWHKSSGGALEPDTAVWAALPAPWEVFSGEKTCTRLEVETACKQFSIDPEKKGWTAPRRNRTAVDYVPTPELVHGVAVSHPALALALRKAGWFSGKAHRWMDTPPVKVIRNEHGMATGVIPAVEENIENEQ